MKIFDCFQFFDENMMLDLRLNILNQYVHKFVVVENSFMHSGLKKKPAFNINNFSKFKDKIIYILVDELPQGLYDTEKIKNMREKGNRIIDNTLMIEHAQRNSIVKGLKDAEENDLIIISDEDEIPNLQENNFRLTNKKIIHFKQKMFYYKFNLKYGSLPWFGSRACRKKYLRSPQWLRDTKSRKYPLWRLDILFSKSKYNNNQYTTLKRSTLLKFLLNDIPKNKIKLNTQLKSLTYEKKLTLSFSENHVEEFDYLIASDGVFSDTKSMVLNKDIKPTYFNSLALRGNIDNFQNEDISIYFGPGFHFVIYPVNKENEFNFILIIKKQLLDKKMYTDENFLQSLTQEFYKKTEVKLDGKLNNIKSFPIYTSKKIEISEKENIFFLGDALFAIPPSFAQGASQSIESSKELFDQIKNGTDTYYKKRIKKINSINWRSKLNYFSFHLSNPILISFRNSILKKLVNNNSFLDNYLGNIYKG